MRDQLVADGETAPSQKARVQFTRWLTADEFVAIGPQAYEPWDAMRSEGPPEEQPAEPQPERVAPARYEEPPLALPSREPPKQGFI
jgi:hypothetical protein